MLKLLLRFFIWLNNFSYKIISSLVVRVHDGLHPKHKILNYHSFFVNNISTQDTVLDIGCGNGAMAYDLAKKAKSVVGIDILKKNIAQAKQKYSRKNLKYIHGDAINFDFKTKFDIITLSNVLEHIDNRVLFLRKLKPLSTKIIIRVPLITRDWLSMYKKNLGAEYRLDPTHFVEYTEKQFKKEISDAGLTIKKYHIKFGELYAIIK